MATIASGWYRPVCKCDRLGWHLYRVLGADMTVYRLVLRDVDHTPIVSGGDAGLR
jgi:hypothetical protein